jgi:CHAT domain-containing protein
MLAACHARGTPMDDRPFANPFYWAAFTYHGAERLELEGA